MEKTIADITNNLSDDCYHKYVGTVEKGGEEYNFTFCKKSTFLKEYFYLFWFFLIVIVFISFLFIRKFKKWRY